VKTHIGISHDKKNLSCDFCGEEFQRSPAKVREDQNTFCSESCKNNYRTGDNNPNGTNSVSFECDYCGNVNTKIKSVVNRDQEHHYCDNSCQTKHWREESIQSGEDNPMYGGEGSYWRSRHEWKNAREETLNRDSYSCVWCGNTDSLHVHHIVPVFVGGEKYELSNLQVLCADCHKKVHRWIDGWYAHREA
jgi:hypothetical protein